MRFLTGLRCSGGVIRPRISLPWPVKTNALFHTINPLRQAPGVVVRCAYGATRPRPSYCQPAKLSGLFHSITPLRQEHGVIRNSKPFLVTTPIFYVNSAPHLGHLYSLVLADVFRRFSLLQGNETHMLTGTDEHGLKVQQAAEKNGAEPQKFVTDLANIFKRLVEKADIEPSRFIRTTDEDHKELVKEVWNKLVERGWVELKEHKGWYCVSEESFVPEKSAVKVPGPNGTEITVTRDSGKECQWMAEENYHFKLSEFKDKLLKFYKANPTFITPQVRYDEIIQEVEQGLTDLSISRSASRLQWGIPVPDAPSQTIYVWLDALFNYLTYTRGVSAKNQKQVDIFPPDVQIIGKDIMRFHAIYWPAFLMALDMPLPRNLISHAHLLLSSKKMSKSDQNVIDPFELIEKFGIDTVRFYLLHDGPLKDDAEFSLLRLVERYTAVLKNDLGNNLSRMSTPKFAHKETVEKFRHLDLAGITEVNEGICGPLAQLPVSVVLEMERCDPTGALKHIVEVIGMVSKYFHTMEPWKKENSGSKDQTIFLTGEALRIIGILLQPFMPSKASEMLDILGVDASRRRLQDAVIGADFDYGVSGEKKKTFLFPTLE